MLALFRPCRKTGEVADGCRHPMRPDAEFWRKWCDPLKKRMEFRPIEPLRAQENAGVHPNARSPETTGRIQRTVVMGDAEIVSLRDKAGVHLEVRAVADAG
jgi:hypothetical protein